MTLARTRIHVFVQLVVLQQVLLLLCFVGRAGCVALVSSNIRLPPQRFFYVAATPSAATLQTKVRLLRQADNIDATLEPAEEGSCCQGAGAAAEKPIAVSQPEIVSLYFIKNTIGRAPVFIFANFLRFTFQKRKSVLRYLQLLLPATFCRV